MEPYELEDNEEVVQIKRGDTLDFLINVEDINHVGIDLDISDIRSEIRHNGTLIGTFQVSKTETIGKYLFEAGDTNRFPIGLVDYDIEFTVEGKPYSSQTCHIDVIADVTRPVEV